MAIVGFSNDRRNGAADVWTTVWSALDEFVADFRTILGSHLRDPSVALRAIDGDHASRRGMLSIGSTEIHLDCPLRCVPPSDAEMPIARAFGVERPLARIFVRRKLRAVERGWPIESTLVAEPASRVWIATEPELGPASLGDRASLERFFWHLVVDRHA